MTSLRPRNYARSGEGWRYLFMFYLVVFIAFVFFDVRWSINIERTATCYQSNITSGTVDVNYQGKLKRTMFVFLGDTTDYSGRIKIDGVRETENAWHEIEFIYDDRGEGGRYYSRGVFAASGISELIMDDLSFRRFEIRLSSYDRIYSGASR